MRGTEIFISIVMSMAFDDNIIWLYIIQPRISVAQIEPRFAILALMKTDRDHELTDVFVTISSNAVRLWH